MTKSLLTDEQIDAEIERLKHSEAVRLAKKAEKIKYARRRYLSRLRSLEKKGLELQSKGITLENITAEGLMEE